MPNLTIDGIQLEVEAGTSILQACEQLGIEIPRFCYHDRLSVPANCRMCLVQVKNSPKPVPSCAQPCADNMEVLTGSEMVHKARKGVMEFLLINHPLDCPICDQGGECDLQDQAMGYGFDRSRYVENKRAVQDKELGPLVKTSMNRCIHCTRCVRFSEEIAGVSELGVLGRGEHMEIGTYIAQAVTSELSGNLVDVCPVGALTHKPYAFKARPWELRKTESVDVMDAVGSNIRIDARGAEVMRILPRLHEEINEEWLADKSRYAYDGLKRQRLDQPYVRVNGKLQPVSWDIAFQTIAQKLQPLKGDQIAAITGDLCAAEEMLALKRLMEDLGSPHLECRQDGAQFDVYEAAGWRFNSTITGIEQADLILLIGTNPRHEAPMINARMRKAWRANGTRVINIGKSYDLTYPVEQLTENPAVLQQLVDDRHPLNEAIRNAKFPLLILGTGALQRRDGMAIHGAAYQLAHRYMKREGWNGFNFLHLAAARAGALALGFVPQGKQGKDLNGIVQGVADGNIKAVYLLGADEAPVAEMADKAFLIYQGHHGDRAAAHADVILPGLAYTEKNGTYVNTEGRAQHGRQAAFPLGNAKEDWKIIRALSDHIGGNLNYVTIADLREDLASEHTIFANIDQIVPSHWTEFGATGPIEAVPFTPPIANYYMTDTISRASETMAKCTAELLPQQEIKQAA